MGIKCDNCGEYVDAYSKDNKEVLGKFYKFIQEAVCTGIYAGRQYTGIAITLITEMRDKLKSLGIDTVKEFGIK